jgi:hypothetical protein
MALLGQVKGEHHWRQHLMYAVDKTSSGIDVRKAILDLIIVREDQGLTDGPVICEKNGVQWTTARANEMLHDLLVMLLLQDPSLFPSHIRSHDNVVAKYHVYRSFRRASDSRAIAKEVAIANIPQWSISGRRWRRCRVSAPPTI